MHRAAAASRIGSTVVIAIVAFALVPSARAATNVVPNPGFEQGGCGTTTPVICGWKSGSWMSQDVSSSGNASMSLACGPLGCYGGGWASLGASTDSAFCVAIGPGTHPASVSFSGSWGWASLGATFYQGPDCTGTASYDALGDWTANEALTGDLVAPPGTQSALFDLALSVPCDDFCSIYANFDDVDVEGSVVADTTPPQTTITSAAPDPPSTSATFEFTASEQSSFECSLDDAPFATCTSPATYSTLADGPHSFRVRATDRAGNTDPTPAEQDWTVDTFFSLAATPDSLSLAPEGFGQATIQTTGSAQPISLSASGQPATTAVWFSPSWVVAGGSSTMMVSVGTATQPGTYTIVVTGAGTSVSHTTTVTLVVSATDFSLSASPLLMYVQQGSSGTGTVGTFSLTPQTVALSATGQPDGTSVSFSPASVTAGASSTMTVSVGPAVLWGNYALTIIGTGPSTTHTLTITLIVELSNAEFSIAASPASLNLARGAAGTTTIQTATTSGSPQAIGLSANGQPASTVVSFSPASVTSGGSSTMNVNVGTATPLGTYAITVTGSGTSGAHTTTVALTVTANQPPTAGFTLSCAGLTCSFDAGASTDGDGTLLSYSWSFGDGTGGSGKTATHTYPGGGSYTVTLTVTDDAGATATDSQTVNLIVLTARGYKVKGLQKVELTWSGPNRASFDVYRDGAKIATVQATAYTDNLNAKGSATHTYRVCAPAKSTCSNEAKVSF